jgi:hypothetical protein
MLLTFRKIKAVTIELDDGTMKVFIPNDGAAFFREGMTYEEAPDSNAIEWVLTTHEIFWAERYKADGQSPSQSTQSK